MSTDSSNTSLEQDLIRFLKNCCYQIQEQCNGKVVLEGTAVFLQRLEAASLKEFEATQQPVLTQLNQLTPTPIISGFEQLARQMKWRPSPRTDYDAKVMALSALNEMLNLGDVVAGLLFMTPNQTYPEHQHPPQETYFILSGDSDWMHGGNDYYAPKQAGDIIYNHSQDLHGIKSKEQSLLALYFLWGDRAGTYSF